MSINSKSLYTTEDVVELCNCTDRCMVPMVVVKVKNGKFALYGCSEVYGMGSGEWENKILNLEFDEVIPSNGWNGISHVAIRQHDKWGLIEIIDNGTVACDWTLIAEIKHTKAEIDTLLKNNWKNDFDPHNWLVNFEAASERRLWFQGIKSRDISADSQICKKRLLFCQQ